MVSENGGRKRNRLGERRSASGRSFVFLGYDRAAVKATSSM
jgi:hypothetical protein